MALDERERLELRQALVEMLGPEQGNRLMNQVPPFDWADVAMKQDLRDLELALKHDLDQRFKLVDQRFEMIEPIIDAKLGQRNRTLFLALVGLMLAQSSLTLAAFTLAR